MNLQSILLPLIILGVLILAGLIGWLAYLRIHSIRLRKKFGSEYDYTLDKLGDRRTAEADLAEREKRVVRLDIHALNDHEKDRYHDDWTEIQAGFVDDPTKAVGRANRLITEVMIARGFPVADFEQRTADLSVVYPDFAPKYRQANAIATKNQDGGASTEELRQAMVNYHALFDQLLGTVHAEVQIKEQELEKT